MGAVFDTTCFIELPHCDKNFWDANLDYIARTVDITAVGPMRVIKAFYRLLKRSKKIAAIYNISSEAGSISKCYRTNVIDYGMAKAALNMATMNLHNEAAEILRKLFEERREDKTGHRFITNLGEDYPF